MVRLFTGWPLRLSAAASAAALLAIFLLVMPGNQAKAAEVLERGIQRAAKLGSIHLIGRLRTLPRDNFAYIAPDRDFCKIELWKQFGNNVKWRVEKPERIAVMDGQSTIQFIKGVNIAYKFPPSQSAFDTDWLHKMSDLGNAIGNELRNARALKWPLKLSRESATDGTEKSIVTIGANSDLPENDYLRNCFMDHAATKRVYYFDSATGMLEKVQIFLSQRDGYKLIFETTAIQCDQLIDPAEFHLEVPANTSWWEKLQLQPGDEKYLAMTAEQFAKTFFEACSREDWQEANRFFGGFPLTESTKMALGGLRIRHVGQAFSSAASPWPFVPYEIQLRTGQIKKWNLALKRDEKTGLWFVDGGI